jgi:heme-degrading monooxygenase HmoA
MSNAVFYNSYKLIKGASVPDFLIAIDNLAKQISKNKGFISSTLLLEGDTWADYSTWESMDDLKAFLELARTNKTDLAEEFYSFLNFNTCKSHVYSVERNWQSPDNRKDC